MKLLSIYFYLLIITSISSISAEEIKSVNAPKKSILQVMQKRHSGYDYDSTKFIKSSHLKLLLEAARLAPSSYNDQPWHIILCDRLKTPEEYLKALDSMVEFNREWSKTAPLLIIAVSHRTFDYNDKPNLWADYDTGAAIMSLSLMATDLGLMTHQIGGFDVEKLKVDFSIPENYEPMSIIAVGYKAPAEEESQLKDRKPINENFFIGRWGAGIDQKNR